MAAGRDMNARIIVRLQDRFSAGMGALQRRLDGIMGAMRRLSAIAGIGAALSFAGPIQQAAAYDQSLRDIALTASATGAEVGQMIRRLEGDFNRLALESGRRSTDIAAGAAVLIAAGMDRALVDRLMPTIARVATATNASIADVAQAAFTLSDAMRIGPDEMERTLARMVQAGKEGRFEFRDMAREFPGLTAAAAGLGMVGERGVMSLNAMLQVARRGAATSSQAATNLENFLQKLTSPETVRNFREMGVNLEELLADAARRGINPVEAVIQKVRELTGGNMFRVGELFGDMQVLNFLRPMLQNVPEYLRIVRAQTETTAGLIGQDFAAQMEGPTRQLEVFMERFEQFGRRFGAALAPSLGLINTGLGTLMGWIEALDGRYPGLIERTMTWGAAILGVLAAISLLTSPIALVVAGVIALAAAAALIYEHWDDIVGFFSGLWDAVLGIFARVGAAFTAFANSEQVRWLIEAWTPVGAFFRALWDGITTAFTAAWAVIEPIINAVAAGAELIASVLPNRGSGRTAGGSGPLAPQGQGLRRPVASGFYPPEATTPGGTEARVGGEIVVRAAPGTEIVDATSRNPSVPITPNRGTMLAVP